MTRITIIGIAVVLVVTAALPAVASLDTAVAPSDTRVSESNCDTSSHAQYCKGKKGKAKRKCLKRHKERHRASVDAVVTNLETLVTLTVALITRV